MKVLIGGADVEWPTSPASAENGSRALEIAVLSQPSARPHSLALLPISRRGSAEGTTHISH